MAYQSTEELDQEHQRRREELAALNVALNALKYITSPDAVRAVLAIRAAIETQLEPARYAVDTSGLAWATRVGEQAADMQRLEALRDSLATAGKYRVRRGQNARGLPGCGVYDGDRLEYWYTTWEQAAEKADALNKSEGLAALDDALQGPLSAGNSPTGV